MKSINLSFKFNILNHVIKAHQGLTTQQVTSAQNCKSKFTPLICTEGLLLNSVWKVLIQI